ncbi:MAG: LytTR family transcriptional regulator DNA-binding domain-containing protein, partial [Saprospiraceae bacterium]|nr:LytTR family transcriptional regulator DNA-binding domain-containing protein [Saprospiraceae bacterium]
LQRFSFVEVIGECKNGREALNKIGKYRPDLVFLDIQMPDLNGIELLTDHPFESLPFIIFVTAYDQYALRAFDLQAVDYLLKPYDDERFAKALHHARQQIMLQDKALLHEKMVRILHEHQHQQEDSAELIEIKEKGRTRYLHWQEVHWVESDGNYLKLHGEQQTHLLRQTLQALEEQLERNFFLRIHRSILFNTLHFDAARYLGNNQYQILLKSGARLQSSRSYKDRIVEFLEDLDLKKQW